MISNVLLVLALFLMSAGLVGLFRFKGVYSRILNSSKIDSAAVTVLMLALMLRTGFSMMTLKLVVVLIFYLTTNPVSSQIIASSAHRNGVAHERGVSE